MAIFKKNGNWYIDYYCEGRRLREKVGPSKKQAEQMFAIRKAEILQGRFSIRQRRRGILFEELAAEYLEYSKATKLSYKRDEGLVRHLLRFFGGKRLNQVATHMIEKYKARRRQEILARRKYREKDPRDVPMSTINRELVCLKHMFNLAIKWGKAEHNPVKGVRLFREENHAGRLLTEEESDALVEACNGHVRGIVILALNTGMRLGEILNLKWDRVDMRQGYITVTKTKSGKERKVPMNGVARNVLKNRLKDGIFVFSKGGKPFGSVKTGFKNALRRSGIGCCRFHDLRHTFATRLVLSGTSLPVVQELLGHASIMTTMRYAHPTPESKQKAVDALEWRKVDLDGHYMDTRGIRGEEELYVTNSP